MCLSLAQLVCQCAVTRLSAEDRFQQRGAGPGIFRQRNSRLNCRSSGHSPLRPPESPALRERQCGGLFPRLKHFEQRGLFTSINPVPTGDSGAAF